MRTILFKKHFLLLALAATLIFSLTPAIASQAHDGEDEDGEEIVVLPDIQQGGCHTRMPALIPIQATLLRALSLIHIELLFPIDNLSVKLTNLSTEQSAVYPAGSTLDIYLPVPFGEGPYKIEFLIENDSVFSGFFYL